ncbi:MAG TPA: Os1348 family NHLP clan protein [Ktedonobacteraceae bacterium]|nr:Os1348 family NHLP clan protein [Ktedonobacteraceae bacterium]
MSWQTIHNMLGLAIIDPKFANRLLANPLLAAEDFGFDLSIAEREALRNVQAGNITELGQILLKRLSSEEHPGF